MGLICPSGKISCNVVRERLRPLQTPQRRPRDTPLCTGSIRREKVIALNRSAVGSPQIGKCAQSTDSLTRAERSVGNDNPSLVSAVRLTLEVNCVGSAIGR